MGLFGSDKGDGDGPRIDIGEAFGIVSGAAGGVSSALASDAAPSAIPLLSEPLDIGTLAIGGAVGYGAGVAGGFSPVGGAVGGAVAAYLLRAGGYI